MGGAKNRRHMKVVFFHRKPRPNFNFSVENLFKQVRRALPREVEWEVKEARYFSQGFFKRLYIAIEAVFRQKDVNHITGDINFIAILLRGKRTVLTMLDMGLMNRPDGLARLILKWFWITLPAKRVAIITTISEATKTELLKFVKIDSARVKVVYVPISDKFVPTPRTFDKEMPTILQIGTKPNKNVLRLVKALKGIRCRLEIVGEVNHELSEALHENAIVYSASKNLSNEEVLEKYKNCDILSFVSTYEGFGMPIVEANAIGRVVVTSNVLSMPEVAGNAAHLVDPFEVESIRSGIIKVISDDHYRDGLIKNGFENQKRFDVQNIAMEYTEIYRTLTRGYNEKH